MPLRAGQRTLIFGTFFICAGLNNVHSDCRVRAQITGNTLAFDTVERVHDGDTLRLKGGRNIRLIGINAPELGRDGEPDQPYAAQARNPLQQLVNGANHKIGILEDGQTRDRFGRALAHLFLPDGTNISALLLQEGLGWHIAITPNTKFLGCHAQAQQQARTNKRGVWEKPDILDAALLQPEDTGFRLIAGKVACTGKGRQHIWLSLSLNLSIRIEHKDLKYFTSWQPRELLHKRIETSGWIYTYGDRNKRKLGMQVHHPAVIRVIE